MAADRRTDPPVREHRSQPRRLPAPTGTPGRGALRDPPLAHHDDVGHPCPPGTAGAPGPVDDVPLVPVSTARTGRLTREPPKPRRRVVSAGLLQAAEDARKGRIMPFPVAFGGCGRRLARRNSGWRGDRSACGKRRDVRYGQRCGIDDRTVGGAVARRAGAARPSGGGTRGRRRRGERHRRRAGRPARAVRHIRRRPGPVPRRRAGPGVGPGRIRRGDGFVGRVGRPAEVTGAGPAGHRGGRFPGRVTGRVTVLHRGRGEARAEDHRPERGREEGGRRAAGGGGEECRAGAQAGRRPGTGRHRAGGRQEDRPQGCAEGDAEGHRAQGCEEGGAREAGRRRGSGTARIGCGVGPSTTDRRGRRSRGAVPGSRVAARP